MFACCFLPVMSTTQDTLVSGFLLLSSRANLPLAHMFAKVIWSSSLCYRCCFLRPELHGIAGQLKVSDLVTSLREIAHADSQMAYHLWVLVFPIVWATLAEKKDQQVQLAKPIIQLLSKEHHSKQTQQRPNVVQVCAEPGCLTDGASQSAFAACWTSCTCAEPGCLTDAAWQSFAACWIMALSLLSMTVFGCLLGQSTQY